MLTLVLGRAGSGKTSYIMNDFKDRIARGMKRLLYIVPEQYSHDAERQLLKICGDKLSLHGEVLSFSRLCSRVFAETGGLAAALLDDGGRLLVMSRAVDAVAGKLAIYGNTEQKADFLEELVAISKEFKSACLSPSVLDSAAELAKSPLREKLHDLSLIIGAYDGFFNSETANPDDRLGRLVRVLSEYSGFEAGHIYIDGFTDFTAQEMQVIKELVRLNAELTVCLTCDSLAVGGLDDGEEIFRLSRETALSLIRMAEDCGAEAKIIEKDADDSRKAPELRYLEQNLFRYNDDHYQGECPAVEIHSAATPGTECEYAASKVLEFVRAGYRWRDIAVAVCDNYSYELLAESIFEKYDIPVYINRKSAINQKPPVALIEYVFEIITAGWDHSSVFRYLKTGMTGIEPSDCDVLENYVLQWNLRGGIWTREEDWSLPLSGYERSFSDDDETKLQNINALRRSVVKPIAALQKELRRADTFGGKLKALCGFLKDIELPRRIEEKADVFLQAGDIQRSDEYRQLWDIIVKALDQFNDILGDTPGSNLEFLRLWKLLISQYNIATIPVSLDRVGVGDLSRQRRRNLKCLIVIGASDDALPATGGTGGLLSSGERSVLQLLGVNLSGTAEDRLYREMNSIYLSLALPEDKLAVSYSRTGSGGSDKRPSFVVKRLKSMFSLQEQADSDFNFRLNALRPCFELASAAKNNPDSRAAAAAFEYFSESKESNDWLQNAVQATDLSRGRLSGEAAKRLYGKDLVISASRVDKYYSCRFMYFLQYGLNAKPRKPAGFDAPTAGTFMHYLLENVTRDIKNSGGFHDVTEEQCRELTDKYVDIYISDVLGNFKDKTSRFKYLFNRLVGDASFVVLDMVNELKNSDFSPLDFELEFSETGDIPPHLILNEGAKLRVKGFVDRVDGWERDSKLYLRVVDYKTGKKAFRLSDVWHGMNMQMLIYLFALHKNGSDKYKREIIPAAVLYAPARDEIIPASRNAAESEIDEIRQKKLKRSGLILSDESVVEAMEHGVSKKYLPVRLSKDGLLTGDSLAGLEQLGKLSSHIDKMLLQIAGGIRKGSIDAEPYYKNQSDNACLYCDYRTVCRFSEKDGDKRHYLKKLSTDEAWELIAKEAES
ncbi:MAG: ATP-dependent nuclease subunit B [Clostridiales bacterium]|nr:ATP-dependent nuclease subunit B [Clostridiales bacterium]